MLATVSVNVQQEIRIRRKRTRLNRNQESIIRKSSAVLVVDPQSVIQHALTDPVTSEQLRLGLDPQSAPTEFNQTLYCAEYFRWHRNISFISNGVEYTVGDIVKRVSHPRGAFRIDRLVYSPGNWCAVRERLAELQVIKLARQKKERKVLAESAHAPDSDQELVSLHASCPCRRPPSV